MMQQRHSPWIVPFDNIQLTQLLPLWSTAFSKTMTGYSEFAKSFRSEQSNILMRIYCIINIQDNLITSEEDTCLRHSEWVLCGKCTVFIITRLYLGKVWGTSHVLNVLLHIFCNYIHPSEFSDFLKLEFKSIQILLRERGSISSKISFFKMYFCHNILAIVLLIDFFGIHIWEDFNKRK